MQVGMTKSEFLDLQGDAPLPIMMADGRMGLCNHWTDHEVLVDVYGAAQSETVRVPYAQIKDAGGGALMQSR